MFGLALLAALVVVAALVLLLVARHGSQKDAAVGQVTGDAISGDEIVVLVRGWSSAEVASILNEFRSTYDLPAASLRAIGKDEATIGVRIVQPIRSDLLPYLVNYLHYPKARNLNDRQIAAVAVVERIERLGGPAELAGRPALIYVPANDSEFDQVFLRVEPNRHFRISFTRLQWQPVNDGRETATVRNLARAAMQELSRA
jgi:hypothetical protein